MSDEKAPPLSREQMLDYAGIWLLKKMDLKPEDGGMVVPFVMPGELSPLDDVVEALFMAGYIQPDKKQQRYQITPAGYAYIGELIDEAQGLIDEYDEFEVEEVISRLRAARLDVLRARFLWEWYTGELDDLALFQERRGIQPVERLWAYYLVSDDFYRALAADLEVAN